MSSLQQDFSRPGVEHEKCLIKSTLQFVSFRTSNTSNLKTEELAAEKISVAIINLKDMTWTEKGESFKIEFIECFAVKSDGEIFKKF